MGVNWNEAAEGTPKLDEGYHRVTISKVVRTKGENREEMTNKHGEPTMLVIFADDSGAEATSTYTLTPARIYFFARLIKACGLADALTAKGIGIEDFRHEKYYSALVGKSLWASVTHKGEYANAAPVTENEVPPGYLQRQPVGAGVTNDDVDRVLGGGGHAELDDDSIPFAADRPLDW
jgi:hypothetical protein